VGSRFGFIFSIVNTVDSGLSYSREGQHHLVVTLSEPTPSGPLAVRVVGPVKVVEVKPAADHLANRTPQAAPGPTPSPSSSPGPRARTRSQFRPRNPALDDPNLNRLL